MGGFIIRRAAQAVLVMAAATFLLYTCLISLGDPFQTFSSEKVIPPGTRQALHIQFGLDKPFHLQYLTYMRNLFTGKLGMDYEQRRPVADLVGAALPNTLRLMAIAIALDALIGIVSGVIAAVWQYSFWDVTVTVATTLLIGVSTFVIGIILRTWLSGVWIFPPVAYRFTVHYPWWHTVILPAVTLAVVDAAFVARLMRGSMLEAMRADYVRTARAKGLPERLVVFKHAMRNSILPVVTYLGINVGVLMGGAVITESFFRYPGLGLLFYRAISTDNIPVIMAAMVVAVIAFVTMAAVVDVLYAVLDPRIRVS